MKTDGVFDGTVYDDERGCHDVRLVRARDTHIRRHVKIQGDANPYDPARELYFEERLAGRMASTLTGRGTVRYLWMQQAGKCLMCGEPLALAGEWHVHHLRWRTHGGDDTLSNLVLLHPNCHRQVHSERWRRLRPARGVRKGSSRMRGNSHVRFPGEGPTATLVPYPTEGRNG
jgi:RNA-directed DNA polymerase